MVVAVQQPIVELTAIITVCIVEHRSLPCAATQSLHRSTVESRTDSKTVPASTIKVQHTKAHFWHRI